MSSLLNAPYMFSLGFYAVLALVLCLIVFLVFRYKKGAVVSAFGLAASLVFLVLVMQLGDWKIPDCYDSDGNLTSHLPQCKF